jgi:hypothetical protein
MVLEIWIIQGASFFKARSVAKLVQSLLRSLSQFSRQPIGNDTSLRKSNSSENTTFRSQCTRLVEVTLRALRLVSLFCKLSRSEAAMLRAYTATLAAEPRVIDWLAEMDMYQCAVEGKWESLFVCSEQSLVRHESVCNYVAMAHAHSMKVRSLVSLGDLGGAAVAAKSMLTALGKHAGSDLYLLYIMLAMKVHIMLGEPDAAEALLKGEGSQAHAHYAKPFLAQINVLRGDLACAKELAMSASRYFDAPVHADGLLFSSHAALAAVVHVLLVLCTKRLFLSGDMDFPAQQVGPSYGPDGPFIRR